MLIFYIISRAKFVWAHNVFSETFYSDSSFKFVWITVILYPLLPLNLLRSNFLIIWWYWYKSMSEIWKLSYTQVVPKVSFSGHSSKNYWVWMYNINRGMIFGDQECESSEIWLIFDSLITGLPLFLTKLLLKVSVFCQKAKFEYMMWEWCKYRFNEYSKY